MLQAGMLQDVVLSQHPPDLSPLNYAPQPLPLHALDTHTHTLRFLSGQRNGLSPRVTGILSLSTTDLWGQIILLWEVVLCILGCFSCIPPVPLEARSTPPPNPSTTSCDNQIRLQTLPVSSGGKSHPEWRTTSIG